MIINMTGAGGAGNAYAAIGAEYPVNSTCTCYKDGKTLKAKNKSGKALFLIPEEGNWTVACAASDGKKKEQAVRITAEGQCVNVKLGYSLPLIENGEVVDGLAWSDDNGHKSLLPAVDVSGYSKLVYTIYLDEITSMASYLEIGLYKDQAGSQPALVTKYDYASGIALKENAKEFAVEIPSTVTGVHYFGIKQLGLAGHIKGAYLE